MAFPAEKESTAPLKRRAPRRRAGRPAAGRARPLDDWLPGLRRRRAGRGFVYLDARGCVIRDSATRARIAALAIPPAYTDVWISPEPHSRIQATGRDARGRKQYRYHPAWRARREAAKYERMVAFGRALPRMRARVDEDLARPAVCRQKVLAMVVRLLEATLIRVGNEEYARANGSYGLTTLRTRHVDVNGSAVRFRFRGKSGILHDIRIQDPRIARALRRCLELPGKELFLYLDAQGEPRPVQSGDVNDYIQSIAGADFTAKDYRTWVGSVVAMAELAGRPCGSRGDARREIGAAMREVAARMGNTPAICRSSYVYPPLLEAYSAGQLGTIRCRPGRFRSREEAAFLRFLERRHDIRKEGPKEERSRSLERKPRAQERRPVLRVSPRSPRPAMRHPRGAGSAGLPVIASGAAPR